VEEKETIEEVDDLSAINQQDDQSNDSDVVSEVKKMQKVQYSKTTSNLGQFCWSGGAWAKPGTGSWHFIFKPRHFRWS
jgi:hypothetical protein